MVLVCCVVTKNGTKTPKTYIIYDKNECIILYSKEKKIYNSFSFSLTLFVA